MEVAVGSELGIWQKRQSDAHIADSIAPSVTLLGIADGFGELARGTPIAPAALATVRDYLRRRAIRIFTGRPFCALPLVNLRRLRAQRLALDK